MRPFCPGNLDHPSSGPAIICGASSLGTRPLRVPRTTARLVEAMPIYEYRCEQGHKFEVMQRMSDDPVVSCETCAAPVERVFHPIVAHALHDLELVPLLATVFEV